MLQKAPKFLESTSNLAFQLISHIMQEKNLFTKHAATPSFLITRLRD